MAAVPATPETIARIGPNAVIQVAAALRASVGQEEAGAVFAAAGLADWFDHPPQIMIDEIIVATLHQKVRATLPGALATRIMSDAGQRTGEYILARRIPSLVRRLLPRLPAGPARRLLLAAIRRNAWTFAGSGRFIVHPPRILAIIDNPLVAGEIAASPVCHWHAAVFTVLFRHLVEPGIIVRETACRAGGGDTCRFEILRRHAKGAP